MLERMLPQVSLQASVGEDMGIREPSHVRELVREARERIKKLLRAMVDFFAGGGPLS